LFELSGGGGEDVPVCEEIGHILTFTLFVCTANITFFLEDRGLKNYPPQPPGVGGGIGGWQWKKIWQSDEILRNWGKEHEERRKDKRKMESNSVYKWAIHVEWGVVVSGPNYRPQKTVTLQTDFLNFFTFKNIYI
jgi:hypothetical protein